MSSRAPTNAPTSPAPEVSPDHDTHTDADGEDDEEVIHDEFHEAFTLLDGIHDKLLKLDDVTDKKFKMTLYGFNGALVSLSIARYLRYSPTTLFLRMNSTMSSNGCLLCPTTKIGESSTLV